MPFALDIIRKLGERGHQVRASDTFSTAPGSHSRYVEEAFVTASPRHATDDFIEDVMRIGEGVDLIVPSFEECFYLAAARDRLPAPLFAPSLESLRRLHHKGDFLRLARELELRAPPTTIVSTPLELREATLEEGYFARPAYSRGGVELLTDRGPLAGEVCIDDCAPTEGNPWLVQPFMHGTEVCTFSVARAGRVVAHVAYEHPRTIEHAGGIVFESIESPLSLRIAQRIVEATDYEGHLGLDFMRTDEGLVLIEANPRATAGVTLLSSEAYASALTAPGAEPVVAPAGRRLRIDVALLRDMLLHWREIPADLAALLQEGEDVYLRRGDLMPAVFSLLSYSHVMAWRFTHPMAKTRSALLAAQFDDVEWNGEALSADS